MHEIYGGIDEGGVAELHEAAAAARATGDGTDYAGSNAPGGFATHWGRRLSMVTLLAVGVMLVKAGENQRRYGVAHRVRGGGAYREREEATAVRSERRVQRQPASWRRADPWETTRRADASGLPTTAARDPPSPHPFASLSAVCSVVIATGSSVM